MNPQYIRAHFLFARILEAEGKAQEALEELRKCVGVWGPQGNARGVKRDGREAQDTEAVISPGIDVCACNPTLTTPLSAEWR